MTLEERIGALEKKVAELDGRTSSMIKLGPCHNDPFELDPEVVKKLIEDVHKIMQSSPISATTELPTDVPSVDRSAQTLTDGSPVTTDHREIEPVTGMQKGYVVLSAAERAKGFVRPVRRSYKHLTCGSITTMGLALAETYARDPEFYSGTFCATCRAHFPLVQFVWDGATEMVGS